MISVLIPVYETEPYLEQCLTSVLTQDFSDFEIVVVSDHSPGKDERKRSAKKILRETAKKINRERKKNSLPPVSVTFYEHRENLGLLETRRTLLNNSRGQWLIQQDSDDIMLPGALTALYQAALEKDADIVQGKSIAGTFDQEGNFIPSEKNRNGNIFLGQIEGRDIFRKWLIDNSFTDLTWAKLIRRELWEEAFSQIPMTQCGLADDVLVFFFLSQHAKRYLGIDRNVYHYRVDSGMTSKRKIDTLQKWRMICSASSVFCVIADWMSRNKENPIFPLKEDEIEKIRELTRFYLMNNLRQLKETVTPELKSQAREMLGEYWGESFVQRAEQSL